MSSLKNASLVLKTGDLVPTPAVVLGYISGTTLTVTSVVSGTIAQTSIIYGSTGVVTSNATWNTSTGGVGTLTVAGQTATPTTTTQNCSTLSANIFFVATTTQAASSVSATGVLTLGGANPNVAIGQVVAGTGVVAGTTIIGGAGLTWQLSNNTAVASTTISFFTPNPAITIGSLVFGTGIAAGTTVVAGPNYSSTLGIYYVMSTTSTNAAQSISFMVPLTVNCMPLSDATVNNQYGSTNSIRSKMTWNNINLRTVLGDMYDKFDTFNICLNTVSTANPTAIGGTTISTNTDNLQIIFKLSGLPLINQTYNTYSGHNEMSTNIGSMTFTAAAITQYFFSNNIATFGKNSDICSITIEYNRVIDGLNPSSVGPWYQTAAAVAPFPNVMFLFDIIGIDKDTKNGTRFL